MFSILEPDEDRLRAEAGELQQLLQQHLWPALGISSQGHTVLHAWIHFYRFAGGGSAALLAVTKSNLLAVRDQRSTGHGETSNIF
jgi:hypothetical protein